MVENKYIITCFNSKNFNYSCESDHPPLFQNPGGYYKRHEQRTYGWTKENPVFTIAYGWTKENPVFTIG